MLRTSAQNEGATKSAHSTFPDIISYYDKSNVASTLATTNTALKELSSAKKIHLHELNTRITKTLPPLIVLQRRLMDIDNEIAKFKPQKNVDYNREIFQKPWDKIPKKLQGILFDDDKEKYHRLQEIVLNLKKDIANTQAAFDLAEKIILDAPPAETSSRRSSHTSRRKSKSSEQIRRSSMQESNRLTNGEDTKLLKQKPRKDTRRHSYDGTHLHTHSGASNAPEEVAPLPPILIRPVTPTKPQTSRKWMSKNLLFFVGKQFEKQSWLNKWIPFFQKDQMQLAKLFMSTAKEDDSGKKYQAYTVFSNKHKNDKTLPKLLAIFSDVDKTRKEAEKIENQWMTNDDAKAIATEYQQQTKTACCRSETADQLAIFLHNETVQVTEKRVAVLYYLERHGRKDPLSKIILACKNSKEAGLDEVDFDEAPRLR